MDNTLLSLLSSGKYKTSKDLPEVKESILPYLPLLTGATPQTGDYQPGLIDMAFAIPVAGKAIRRGAGAVKGIKKKLIDAVDEAGLPDAYGESLSYFKDMHVDELADMVKDYYGKDLYQSNRTLYNVMKKIGLENGGIVGYQDGGNVDFDPYADTSLADQLNRMGISVDSDAMGLLPTYDTTGADIAREGYKLRSDATRRGATGNLFDLSRQSEIQAGQTGFAGAGAGLRQFENVREDVISGYGTEAKEQYLGLQSDISGIQKGYERELTTAIGDLPEDSWEFKGMGEGRQTDTYFGDPSQGGLYSTGFGGGVTGGLSGSGLSDIRLKKDIEHLFTMDNGVPIYSFKYQWSDDTNIGTMAQDIEGIIPDAVSMNSEGYKMVDYSKVFNHG